MAQIVEEVLIIKLSRMVKDGLYTEFPLVGDEILQTLETVTQELVGNNVIVEVKHG